MSANYLSQKDARLQLKWYNIREAAELCGITASTMWHRVSTGKIAGPSHKLQARKYYSEDDIQDLRQTMRRSYKSNVVEEQKEAMRILRQAGFCDAKIGRVFGISHHTAAKYAGLEP